MEKAKQGRLVRGVGGLYEVYFSDTTRVECKARGALRNKGCRPLIGDLVTVQWEMQNPVLTEILPRKNELIRPAMANLDVLLIVTAAASPAPSFLLLDKLITVAEFHKIAPVIVITKADLHGEAEHLKMVYSQCGFPVFTVEAAQPQGICALRQYLQTECAGCVMAVAGSSGVGKSTLLNRMFPKLMLQTGEVSRKIERGKHTTRSVDLYPMAMLCEEKTQSGFLADTPGFGMLDFAQFDFYTKEDLPYTFREFAPYLQKCRYADCTHVREDGCAVIQAVQEGRFPKERHDSFVNLYETLKSKRPWH